jgi:integrase
VNVGCDERTGKRRTAAQTVAGTFAQASRALTKLLAQVDAGEYRAPVRRTFGEYLTDTWLAGRKADVKTKALSARAYDDYERAVRKLVEHFGAMPLDALDKRAVADVRRTLVEQYAPSAAQRTFDVFRMALRYAFNIDLIAVNPAPAVSRVKTAPPRTGVLTPEQVGTFLTAAEGYRHGTYAALFHVLLLAGLRPGEAAALTWADLDGATLRVERAVTEDLDGNRVVGPTKTRRARAVTLPTEAVAALDRHRKWQAGDVLRRGARAAWADAGASMFTGDDGQPLTVQRIRAAWNTIRKRAKLPPVRLYDARHTYCTTLLHAGVDARTVADLAGHADPAMTLRRYAHATPASKQDAASKLSAALAAVSLPLRRSA